MIRVVIDTNVLVSASIAPGGNEAQLLGMLRRREIVACVSAPMLAEYADVLSRPKFSFAADRIRPLLLFLETETLRIDHVLSGLVSPDPSDTAFMACAMSAHADYLVTGNRRHFPAEAYGTAVVVNAAEMLRRIGAA